MAERTEIAGEINALAVHCRPPIMEVDQRASWLRDWCNDLADYEFDAIRSACREWRQGGSSKFPTPGQLLPLVRKRSMADPPKAPDAQAWRPLTDTEYEDLSLRDKIRHQTILAQEARRKAGPMWKNPPGTSMAKATKGHVEPADMPPTYRHWSEIAAGHEAEAGRLRAYLRRAVVAA